MAKNSLTYTIGLHSSANWFSRLSKNNYKGLAMAFIAPFFRALGEHALANHFLVYL